MLPRLYTEFAPWWPLLSPPEAYMDDARVVHALLTSALGHPVRSLLELGCGSGTLASHLPDGIAIELNDLSADMLAVAAERNPGAPTHCADLRELRLDRTFDAVLVHDALMYLQTEADVAAALQTARAHLKPGGALLLMPDFVEETFYPGTDAGGGDDMEGRAIRLLEWRTDADPTDNRFQVDMALLLQDTDGSIQSVHEQHTMSLFSGATWWTLLRAAGFSPVVADLQGMELESGVGEVFLAVRGA